MDTREPGIYDGSNMVPQRIPLATLTLKNIPDDLHALLKESAERNRRSLNSEILVRLESGFRAARVDVKEEVRRAKAFTDSQKHPVDHSLTDVYKRQGRS